MPISAGWKRILKREKPFTGERIALSVHMEAKTACLCRLLETGGAEIARHRLQSTVTQDDVAAALAKGGMDVSRVGTEPQAMSTFHTSSLLESKPTS
jgi:adenosylhomocysteinase